MKHIWCYVRRQGGTSPLVRRVISNSYAPAATKTFTILRYTQKIMRSKNGTALPWIGDENYELFPIEYKHGSIRTEPEYEYQLCAQAMCIEKMFGFSVNSGAIFFISSHRNHEVQFTKEHRDAVEKTAAELSQMLENKLIPKADYSPKCIKCSLKDICMPKASDSISDYLKSVKQENEKGDQN